MASSEPSSEASHACQNDQRLKLEASAYDASFQVFQHYSSLIWRSRVSIVSLTVLTWVYLLQMPAIASEKELPTPRGLCDARLVFSIGAYMAALLLASLSHMESLYIGLMWKLLAATCRVEARYGARSYFSEIRKPRYLPFSLFYVFNVLVLVVLAVIVLAAYSMSTLVPSVILALGPPAVALLPILELRQMNNSSATPPPSHNEESKS